MKPQNRILRRACHFLSLARRTVEHFREWNLDAWRFFKASTVTGNFFGHESAHLESDIIRLYHVIEKGLCMHEFRPRFGLGAVRQLHSSLKRWDKPGNSQVVAAWRVLEAYETRHRELGIDISDILETPLDVPDAYGNHGEGGSRKYVKADKADRDAFSRVFSSRTSVRHYDRERIPEAAMIRKAVEISLRTPSVCNRQTWKVHSYSGEDAQELLALQNGNRGFGHTIPTVLVVTSDLRQFTGTSERYQSWIDGGMFSMSLLLALHAGGLGAVPLNWSVLNRRDREMRRASGIPDHERIIMLIGCGHPVEQTGVPISTRRSVDDVFTPHES